MVRQTYLSNYKWIQPKIELLMRKNTWYGENRLKRLCLNHTNFLTGSSPSFIMPHTHTHGPWNCRYIVVWIITYWLKTSIWNLIHVTTNQLHTCQIMPESAETRMVSNSTNSTTSGSSISTWLITILILPERTIHTWNIFSVWKTIYEYFIR